MSGERIKNFSGQDFKSLEVGDSIFGEPMLGWKFVAPVPEDIAHAWIVNHFLRSFISRRWLIPSESPMKEWEVGIGIVVGTSMAIFDEEKLNLLHKAGKGEYRLYLSEESRMKKAT